MKKGAVLIKWPIFFCVHIMLFDLVVFIVRGCDMVMYSLLFNFVDVYLLKGLRNTSKNGI